MIDDAFVTRRRRPRVRYLPAAVLLVLALVSLGVIGWWALLPDLRVYVDPVVAFEVEWSAFRDAYHGAGVWKLEILEIPEGVRVEELALGPRGRTMSVALLAPRGRNPLLDEEDLRRGLTGPGGTEGRVANVYPEEILRFMGKHRRVWEGSGTPDWAAVRRYLFTNAAIHEVWHATAASHSHNPVDKDSVMFQDPGVAAREFGSRYLGFTRGHQARLENMFAPLFPGGESPFDRG